MFTLLRRLRFGREFRQEKTRLFEQFYTIFIVLAGVFSLLLLFVLCVTIFVNLCRCVAQAFLSSKRIHITQTVELA